MTKTVAEEGTQPTQIATSIMVPKTELGPAEIAEVLTAYRAGEQVTVIAKRFGIHRATVHLHLTGQANRYTE